MADLRRVAAAVLTAALLAACTSDAGSGLPSVSTEPADPLETSNEAMPDNPDQAVLDELLARGARFDEPRVIEHFLYFVDEPSAKAAEAAAIDLGCETNVAAPTPDIAEWGLLCLWPVEIFGAEVIAVHRRAMEQVASEHDGEYDGWGTAIG